MCDFAIGESTAQEGKERQGERGGAGGHSAFPLGGISYYGSQEIHPFLIWGQSLCSQVLWAPCALTTCGAAPWGGGGVGCEDTLSLVMEQGPVLSPSPSPAQPSILT